jgi:hypothetical protein
VSCSRAASSFLPRNRGTEKCAFLPRGDQAYREKSEVFEPISPFKYTSHYAWSSPAMSALQAAFRNSSRSLVPTDLFRVYPRRFKSRLARSSAFGRLPGFLLWRSELPSRAVLA